MKLVASRNVVYARMLLEIGLRHRVQSALNKDKNRNAVARAVLAKSDSQEKTEIQNLEHLHRYKSDGYRYRSLSGTEPIGKFE